MVTVDLLKKDENGLWGLLQVGNDQYDVDGATVADFKETALAVAAYAGVEIDVWNWELPE